MELEEGGLLAGSRSYAHKDHKFSLILIVPLSDWGGCKQIWEAWLCELQVCCLAQGILWTISVNPGALSNRPTHQVCRWGRTTRVSSNPHPLSWLRRTVWPTLSCCSALTKQLSGVLWRSLRARNPNSHAPCVSCLVRTYMMVSCMVAAHQRVSLGAEGVLPSREIESFLRVFKQFAHTLPSRQVVG